MIFKVTFVFFLLFSTSFSNVLNTPPVIWRDTKHDVAESHFDTTLKIHLVNPCEVPHFKRNTKNIIEAGDKTSDVPVDNDLFI